jgi:hypothetical protein
MKDNSIEVMIEIVEVLEHVRKRPRMYMLGEKYSNVVDFLTGFKLSLKGFVNYGEYYEYYVTVLADNELLSREIAPWMLLANQGIDDLQAIDRLLLIEIDTWERIIKAHEDK